MSQCEMCDGTGVRTTCFACGMPICKTDSEVVKSYRNYGTVRLCDRCMEDHAGQFERHPMWRPEHDLASPYRSEFERRA